MGKSVNSVTLLGCVGRDPEVRANGAGTIIANFSLATNEPVKGQDGDWTERAEWHNLVAFGNVAQLIRDYVYKGSKVYIEGRLQTRNWEDKDTRKKVYRTEVVVKDVIFLDGKKEGDSAYPPKSRYEPPQASSGFTAPLPAYAGPQGHDQLNDDDDIPF